MSQDSSAYWKKSRVELRAAGFDPDRIAKASAIVTIASAWTNAQPHLEDLPKQDIVRPMKQPIAAVRDGDVIVIDPRARRLTLDLPNAEIEKRMAGWRPPDLKARVRPGSVHDKYVRLVSSAHHGCVV